MATVHFGRLLGVVGFAKTVAIKRLHPHLARDPEFVSMFLDEARLAARIRHPNVVSTMDVVALEGELFLVMEYVQGESLRQLERSANDAGTRIPPSIAATILVGVLHGLHAAHEAGNERGEPLGIVHRDVSPQNILVGIDGVPRVFDFGVAKAAGRAQSTREGQLKGKIAYMSPEQLMGRPVSRATDIFAASAVLWEALVGRRLFKGESEGEVIKKVLDAQVERPSKLVPELSGLLDGLVLRGLARNPEDRFVTAREMARALERCLPMASASDVGEYVEKMAAPTLAQRAERIAKIEQSSTSHPRASLVARAASAESATVAATALGATGFSKSDPKRPPRQGAPPASVTPSHADHAGIGVVTDTTEVERPTASAFSFLATHRRLLKRGALAAAALAGALLLVALGAALRAQPETRAAAAPAADPVATAASFPTAAPAKIDGPPLSPAEPPPRANADEFAEPPAAHSKAPAAPTPKAPARHGAASCDPPFTIDANGFRHYKRECLQ
jgi:serine/threonine-protein kinase